jgi:Transglutaminase-like superfamily
MLARLQAVIRKVSALRLRELWLLMSSAGLLVALPVLQRVLTLPALVTLFGTKTLPTLLPPLEPERLLFLIRGLLHQRIGMIRPNCMKQSLVLFHFLRQWGAPVTIHFGAATRDGALEGHCWVELAGHPFGEKGNPRPAFTTVYTFPMDNVHQKRRFGWIPRSRTKMPSQAKAVT